MPAHHYLATAAGVEMIKSDRVRALILARLAEGPATWGELANGILDANLQPTHPHTWAAVRDIVNGMIAQGEIHTDGTTYERAKP